MNREQIELLKIYRVISWAIIKAIDDRELDRIFRKLDSMLYAEIELEEVKINATCSN